MEIRNKGNFFIEKNDKLLKKWIFRNNRRREYKKLTINDIDLWFWEQRKQTKINLYILN